MRTLVELEIECPLDGATEEVEIEELEDGSVEVECSVCGATLEAGYTVSVEVSVDGVDVVDPPTAEGDCPDCGQSVEIEEVSEESGEEERDCAECGAALVVRWSEWGQDVEVEIIDRGEVEEDEEEEGEGEEDEEDYEVDYGEDEYGEDDEFDEGEDEEVEDW